MIKILISLILCLPLSINCLAQNNKVYGKVKYEWKKTKPYIDVLSTELIFDESKSLFEWRNKKPITNQENDNTIHHFSNSRNDLDNWILNNSEERNSSGERVIYLKLFINDIHYIVQNDQLDFDWNLEDEYRTIHHFKCQKATTHFMNNKITAWFTEEIPIAYGPHVWTGLPGLVLEVYDDKLANHFIATNLEVNQDYSEEFDKLNNIEIKEFISVLEYENKLELSSNDLENKLNSRRGIDEKPIKFNKDCEDCN